MKTTKRALAMLGSSLLGGLLAVSLITSALAVTYDAWQEAVIAQAEQFVNSFVVAGTTPSGTLEGTPSMVIGPDGTWQLPYYEHFSGRASACIDTGVSVTNAEVNLFATAVAAVPLPADCSPVTTCVQNLSAAVNMLVSDTAGLAAAGGALVVQPYQRFCNEIPASLYGTMAAAGVVVSNVWVCCVLGN